MQITKNPRAGFTLIELLTVIAIIGILAGILIPTLGGVQKRAKQASSLNSMKEIYKSYQLYQNSGTRTRSLASGTWAPTSPNQASSPADFAKALAWYAKMNEAQLYYIDSAEDVSTLDLIPRVVLEGVGNDRGVSSDFSSAEDQISYEMARLSSNAASTSPLVWTKGLQNDGTWDEDTEQSPWGSDGGHILFLNGSVAWHDTVQEGVLRQPDGQAASNMQEAVGGTANRILKP